MQTVTPPSQPVTGYKAPVQYPGMSRPEAVRPRNLGALRKRRKKE